jgi:hypothetical protein
MRTSAISTVGTMIGLFILTHAAILWSVQGGRLGWTCVVIGAAFVVASALGWTVIRAPGTPRTVRLLAVTGLMATVLGWAWQRAAYIVMMPDGVLTYGHFLTGAGRAAGWLVLTLPLWIVSTVVFLAMLASAATLWRCGMRRLVPGALLWWIYVWLVWALPSAYLSAQGEASVFI